MVPEMVPVPIVFVPSLNVTVPEGEEPFASVAVKVTEAPSAGEALEAETTRVGADWPTVTVTAMAADVAAALLVSPPYSAVIECEPTFRPAVV